ncbi:signal-regulatory protein beta-2-like [Pungitius pungitius]|uniref:signal-regulatory protein beta-2-like n=1 Tax=Pungitius pungitius TaxID=134920 RepID=UPI002E1365DD
MMLFYFLLVLRAGRCTDDLIFETKTVGQSVTLTCARNDSLNRGTLFWMRLVSGNVPEFFKGTFAFDYDGDNTNRHITTKQEPGTFLLHIHQATQSDTGVYCCLEINTLYVKLKKWTFLRIKGPEADVSVITNSVPSHPVRPGDSVTLQCSVLSVSEETACPEGQKVFWLKAGSDRSPPHVIYVHGNRDGCEQSPEGLPPHRCVYSFSKNISSSDAGTYYCAAATCGQMLFGNGTKVETEAPLMWDLVLIVLSAALAFSLVVIVFLIFFIKRKTWECCNDAVTLQTAGFDPRGQQRDEDLLTYSAPTFIARKTVRAEREKTATAAGGGGPSTLESGRQVKVNSQVGNCGGQGYDLTVKGEMGNGG